MSENTIFQTNNPPEVPQKNQKQPLIAPAQPISPPQNPLPPPPPFPLHTTLPFMKIGIGIGVVFIVLLLFFGIWQYILPAYFNPKEQKVTVVYWGLWEDKSVMQGIIEDFQKKHPTITVTYSKENIKQYKNRLLTRVATGKDAPDIFRYHNTWLSTIKQSLLPLPNDIITKDEFKKLYYPVVQNDIVDNGAIYGIPFSIDTLALYINTEIFKAAGANPPTTWEEYVDVSRSLTVKENAKIKTAGGALGTFENITHASDIITLLLLQNGANLADLATTQNSALAALDFYTFFAKDPDNIWDGTLDPSILAFAKGNLAMYIGYSWDMIQINALKRQAGNESMVYKIVPVPYPATGKPKTIASYWVDGVFAKSKHSQEALLFLKYLSQKDVAQKLFTQEAKVDPSLRPIGEIYARTDLADSLKNNELAYPFVSQAKNASSSFFASDTFDEDYNGQLNRYLGNAINAILDNASTETALETLVKGVSKVLQGNANE